MRPVETGIPAEAADDETGGGRDIGILIDVREKDFTVDISAVMERAACRALSFVDHWRAREMLANDAGGKQSDGIMGVSNQYMSSPSFLRGDGGLGSLVWADAETYRRIKDLLAPHQKVATEMDVETVAALKAFVEA